MYKRCIVSLKNDYRNMLRTKDIFVNFERYWKFFANETRQISLNNFWYFAYLRHIYEAKIYASIALFLQYYFQYSLVGD